MYNHKEMELSGNTIYLQYVAARSKIPQQYIVEIQSLSDSPISFVAPPVNIYFSCLQTTLHLFL